MLIKHLALFFDTSFISEAHLEDVKVLLDLSVPKYITDSIYGELQKGYSNNPNDERFSSIFQPMSENRPLNNIKIISLGKCVKDIDPIDFTQDTIFFKRSSLLCSGYYAWLHCCVNPSMIMDRFRHMYNAALYMIRSKGDPDNKVSAFMGGLRMQEIDLLERIGLKSEGFTASALRRARKKRLKDIKKNTLKITDYQLVLTAFLYFCHSRNNVMLLTCDYDLLDIKENLIKSVIEKYTLNRLLTEKIKAIKKCGTLGDGNIRICLTGKEVRDELINNTFKRMSGDNLSKGFRIAFYDRRDRKIYGGVAQIPLWLMDFVLEYRLNVTCYSAGKRLEMKYPLNYVMNPTEDLEEIHFNITLRKERQYYGLMPDCEDICNYARKERNTPSDLTSFVEMSVFHSRKEPDFSNPWINRGFVLFRDCRYEEALKAFDKGIDLQHDCADAWYGKGISLGKLDRHEEAFEAFEKVIKLKPDYHAAIYSWGGVLSDLAALRQGVDREALLKGSAEKFARAAVEINPDMHEALCGWGIALWNLAAMHEGTYREELLRKAAEKYAKTLEIKPDMSDAFFGWGAALLDLAAMHEGAAREELLRKAAEKFARAIEINAYMPEALYGCGSALWNLSALHEGTDREELLKKAIEKFAAAAEIKPDMHEALFGWGAALMNLADLHEGPAREELLRKAAEKYAKTVEIKPDMSDAFFGWGAALLDHAAMGEGPYREILLREAIEKFAAAGEIKPDMHKALFGWGAALMHLAALHEGPAREELLRKAAEKYAKTVEIKPDMYEAFYQWGNALGDLAAMHEGTYREVLLREAIEKFAAAAEIKPDMHEALFGWGAALMHLADLHEGHDREELLKKAVEKFAETEEIKSDYLVLCNWGLALLLLAEVQEGDNREASLKQAIEKYAKAIEIEPDDYEALYNLCNALRMLAYIYKGRKRTETLKAALEKAKRFEDLKPGAGIYSMACIYALLGQEKNALASLKKAIESDPQYRQIAAVDEDFRSLWEVQAFKNIVET